MDINNIVVLPVFYFGLGYLKACITLSISGLSNTPAVVASIQVAEVCKILLNEGKPLKQRMLSINLLDMEIVEIQL